MTLKSCCLLCRLGILIRLCYAPLMHSNSSVSPTCLTCLWTVGRNRKGRDLDVNHELMMLTTELVPWRNQNLLITTSGYTLKQSEGEQMKGPVCLLCLVLSAQRHMVETSVNRWASDGEHCVIFFLPFSLPPSCYLSGIPAQLCRAQSLVVMGRGGIVGEDQRAKREAKDAEAD